MSANMKYQKVKRTIIEKFCQNLEVCYFSYIIWERQLEDNSGCLRRILNARPSNLCCFEQPRSLLLCSVVNTTQRFSENKLRNKKKILVYERNTHLWENVYHRDFIQFSLRMEFYGIV